MIEYVTQVGIFENPFSIIKFAEQDQDFSPKETFAVTH